MEAVVTVSPKFQIVIPSVMRRALNIKPGQKIQAIRYGNRMEFIPYRSLQSARGFLAGLDTDIQREKADRL